MSVCQTGPKNLITDVKGLRVGHADDETLKSGATVILCDTQSVAAMQVLGGAPGTRETDLLEPHNMVEQVHAICLSGGSAFGLDAASGVQAYLREQKIGFPVGDHIIPIVPAAILFDLINGGNKDWGRFSPYRNMGYDAANRADHTFELGSVGAGMGALTATLRGGLGSTSTKLDCGFTVGALAAVNPMGSATVGQSPHFWAAHFEIGDEFGGLGLPAPLPFDMDKLHIKFRDLQRGGANTTIATIATDAALTKAQAKRLAIAAHDGFARALWPCHTPFDGDLVFALATGTLDKTPSNDEMIDLCAAASSTMARAIARGVYEASPLSGDLLPAWCEI